MAPPVPPTPKGKFGRQKVLIAGAGLVLVVFLFMRSRGSSTQAAATTDPNAPQTVAQPATFADNGAQAASLGDSVTQGLGDVAGSLADEQTAFQSLADALNANAGGTPAAPTTPSSTVGSGATTPPAASGSSPPQKISMTPAPSSPILSPQFTRTNAPPPPKKPPKPSMIAAHRAPHHH